MTAIVEAALEVADHGIPVIPFRGDKQGSLLPGRKWKNDDGTSKATTDPDVIAGWERYWTRPGALIATVIPDGLVNLDIDAPELLNGHPIPEGPMRIGGRGFHLWLAGDAPYMTKLPGGAGELLGAGHIAILPTPGSKYEWADERRPWDPDLAQVPEWAEPTPWADDGADVADDAPMTTRNELLGLAGRMKEAGYSYDARLAELRTRYKDGRITESKLDAPWTDADFKQIAQNPPTSPPIQAPRVRTSHEPGPRDDDDYMSIAQVDGVPINFDDAAWLFDRLRERAGLPDLPPPREDRPSVLGGWRPDGGFGLDTSAPPPLLMDFISPRPGDVSLLFGDGSTGKGMLSSFWIAQATVMDPPVPVLILDYENHEAEWGQRLKAFGADPRFLVYMRPDTPITHADMQARLQDLRAVGLMVVDSVLYALAGSKDLIADPNMPKQFQEATKRLRFPTLGLAHTPKNAKDATAPFGSTYWHNAARVTWGMTADGDFGPRKLTNHKRNDGGPRLGLYQIPWDWSRTGHLPDALEIQHVGEIPGQREQADDRTDRWAGAARATAKHHASGEVSAINKTALVDLMGEGRRADKMAGIDRAISTTNSDGGRLMAKPGGRSSVLVWWQESDR